jgi:Na+-translocating ferredoxin:NAD+ oxidoreductase RnfD subunit/Pyruvate/2-oxoacid:ferredoxin oxidoreductase delta subunit
MLQKASPHKYEVIKMVKAPMTKDLMMQYTLVALFAIAFLSYFVLGLPSLVISLISLGVAVGCDFLLSMVMGSKGPKNTMSAAVFGLIVALSYSIGQPAMMATETIPLLGELEQYLYPALISAVGLIVFKKLAGLAGRKYVNPAAIAKLLILGLLFMPIMTSIGNYSVLIPTDHINSINLLNPLTPDAFGGPDYHPMDTMYLGSSLITCYSGNPMTVPYLLGQTADPLPDTLYTMLLAKAHGWIGGFSSIVVIAIGLLLFMVGREYFKWRITLVYLVTTAVFAGVMGGIYGGDIVLRILFHVFMGSSIFLAFFMATDPATTPLTKMGQMIFGAGLAILTIVIQTYTGFLGGSILALVIMNLTCPILDRVGLPKPSATRIKIKLPKAKKLGEQMTTDCIRCGRCLTTCCKNLSPILIKQAADKGNWAKAEKLGAAYCDACGHCSFVCPARIDLKSAVVSAREKIKK